MSAGTKQHAPSPHALRYHDATGHRERVEWLIDNRNAYEALLAAIRGARKSIRISQLAFDADCGVPGAISAAGEHESPGRDSELLLDVILDASKANNVSVDILLNATLLLDTARPLARAIHAKAPGNTLVRVRGLSGFPQLLHAKMIIIDGCRAFLMGSPLVNGYWDDACHRPADSRRPRRELGGRPVHDVSVSIEGDAVNELSDLFSDLWNAAEPGGSKERFARAGRRANTPADSRMRVVTTMPKGARARADAGSLGILDELLDGIGRARSLIYIEHQYLSSRSVVGALVAALERHRDLEIVTVLNQNPDVTAYRGWQNARLAEAGFLMHPRVGVFTLWSKASLAPEMGIALSQVFVHSKVVIVDGRWALVGSANLDGVSLDSYGHDFSSWLGRRVFRNVRNMDVALTLHDTATTSSHTGRVSDLQSRLWTEHLGSGFSMGGPCRDGGWVGAWRAQASCNVATLNGPLPVRSLTNTFVLPYSTQPTPKRQLKAIGINAKHDLEFDPGWLEVHCSPNWVRNIFV